MMRWAAVSFLVALIFGATVTYAAGQEIQDSVVVRVIERPEIVVMEGPSVAYRGDRLTYMARALDPDGNPTLAFLVWSVSDTSVAQIVSVTDSTATVEARSVGTFVVRVEVGPLDSLRVGYADPAGGMTWSAAIPVGGEVQACGLFYSGDQPWGFSSHEICYPAYAGTFGAPDAPAGPLYRLTVYGAREALSGGGLTLLAALIRSSPPVDRVALRRMLL
jgi:hypothetical protein